ncbi:MAG: hypothetical protein MJZ38_04435 [archaeon]|nr:hypothetical protein [archaeon]
MADAKKELRTVMMSLYVVILIAIIGIALAILGGVKGLGGTWLFCMIGGIMLAFFGLIFGVPLVWLRNAERRKSLRAAVIILNNERTQISVLASSVGCSDAEARNKAVWALNNGYLPGYVISGDEVLLSRLLDPNQMEHSASCPNCGASFKYVGKIGQCPYCGDYYPPRQ